MRWAQWPQHSVVAIEGKIYNLASIFAMILKNVFFLFTVINFNKTAVSCYPNFVS